MFFTVNFSVVSIIAKNTDFMDFFPLFDFVSYVLAEGVVADDVVGFL